MKSQELKSYFENHPNCKEFHFTSDGIAFFGANEATNHASNLADDKVTTVTREAAEVLCDDAEIDLASEVLAPEPATDFTLENKEATDAEKEACIDAEKEAAEKQAAIDAEKQAAIDAEKQAAIDAELKAKADAEKKAAMGAKNAKPAGKSK
jgi:hypothetical protein